MRIINRPIRKILIGTTKNQINAKYCLLLIHDRNLGLFICATLSIYCFQIALINTIRITLYVACKVYS